jgi:hypothetical protein
MTKRTLELALIHAEQCRMPDGAHRCAGHSNDMVLLADEIHRLDHENKRLSEMVLELRRENSIDSIPKQ